MKYQLTAVGADVEMFVVDQNNNPVPVCGLLGGTKANPVFFRKDEGDAYSNYQEDNVMAEFGIYPSRYPSDFKDNIKSVMGEVARQLKKRHNLFADISASKEFTPQQLSSPQAQHVGCSPDFNAWTGEQNPPVNPELLGNVRTSGGHVHVSWEIDAVPFEELEDNRTLHQYRMVRMLDLTLGVPSILLDTDSRRRKYYGKAGAHRPKEYGVEYRVLSNFWIKNSKYMEWVFNQVKMACSYINLLPNGVVDHATSRAIIETLNTGDKDRALALCDTWRIVCPKL